MKEAECSVLVRLIRVDTIREKKWPFCALINLWSMLQSVLVMNVRFYMILFLIIAAVSYYYAILGGTIFCESKSDQLVFR